MGKMIAIRWCTNHRAVARVDVCESMILAGYRTGRNPFDRIVCVIVDATVEVTDG